MFPEGPPQTNNPIEVSSHYQSEAMGHYWGGQLAPDHENNLDAPKTIPEARRRAIVKTLMHYFTRTS